MNRIRPALVTILAVSVVCLTFANMFLVKRETKCTNDAEPFGLLAKRIGLQKPATEYCESCSVKSCSFSLESKMAVCANTRKRIRPSRMFDVFLYNGELSMLTIRLVSLWHVVDNFIVLESNQTFQGNSKPFHLLDSLKKNENALQMYATKIVHVKVPPLANSDAWAREFMARDQGRIACRELGLQEDDLVVFGDLDEMPRPAVLDFLKHHAWPKGVMFDLVLKFSYYSYYWDLGEWNHEKVVSGFFLHHNISHGKEIRQKRGPKFFNAGWHCSYCLSVPEIIQKLKSFSHTEFSRSPYTDASYIEKRIETGTDLFLRPGHKNARKLCPDSLPPFFETFFSQDKQFRSLVGECKAS